MSKAINPYTPREVDAAIRAALREAYDAPQTWVKVSTSMSYNRFTRLLAQGKEQGFEPKFVEDKNAPGRKTSSGNSSGSRIGDVVVAYGMVAEVVSA